MNRILLTFLVLTVFTSTEINAQKNVNTQLLKHYQLSQNNKSGHLFYIDNDKIKNKPTSGKLELTAYTIGYFDDSVYNYAGQDSVRLFWYKDAGVDFDYIGFKALYPEFTYLDTLTPRQDLEKQLMTFKVDSILYFEYNDNNQKFESEPYEKETTEILNTGFLHYHSKGVYENQVFKEETVYEYKYDPYNRLEERIHWHKNGFSFTLTGKDSFGYNNTGNLLYEGYLSYHNGNFEQEKETIYTYNANNLVSSTANIIKNDSTLNLDTIQMFLYTYNANNNLIETSEREFDGTQLINKTMKVYNYTSNRLSVVNVNNWDAINNTYDSVYKYALAYSGNALPISVTEYQYNNANWIEKIKTQNFYNANGSLDSVIYLVNEDTVLERKSITYYKRNGEDLVEVFEQKSIWDSNDSTWYNNNGDFIMYLYYDTAKIDTTINIHNIKDDTNDFTVYPNPSNEILNVESTKGNIGTIYIYDHNGRIIRQITIHNRTKRASIDVGSLASGIYTLMIHTDKKTIVKKAVVQH